MKHQIQKRKRGNPLRRKLSTRVNSRKAIHCHRLSQQLKSECLKKTFFKYFFNHESTKADQILSIMMADQKGNSDRRQAEYAPITIQFSIKKEQRPFLS
jgi:hypothetical protein